MVTLIGPGIAYHYFSRHKYTQASDAALALRQSRASTLIEAPSAVGFKYHREKNSPLK